MGYAAFTRVIWMTLSKIAPTLIQLLCSALDSRFAYFASQVIGNKNSQSPTRISGYIPPTPKSIDLSRQQLPWKTKNSPKSLPNYIFLTNLYIFLVKLPYSRLAPSPIPQSLEILRESYFLSSTQTRPERPPLYETVTNKLTRM